MDPARSSSRNTNQLNDVFVIGAGASVPYGFRTGANLIQFLRKEDFTYGQMGNAQILSSLGFTGVDPRFESGREALEYWGNSPHGKFCSEWKRLIRGSVILTIDQFLKNLKDPLARDFGKRLMARQILKSEENACMEVSASKGVPSSGAMHSIDWIQEFLTQVDLRSSRKILLRLV